MEAAILSKGIDVEAGIMSEDSGRVAMTGLDSGRDRILHSFPFFMD